MRNTREFSYKGIAFTVADYRPRKNEFEKGLKYQLLIKVYDGIRDCDYHFRPTGHYFSRIRDAKQFARENYWIWM